MKQAFKKFLKSQSGMVDIAGPLLLGISMIMATIGAYFIGPLMTAFLNAYNTAGAGTLIAAQTVIGIGPTLIILGYVVAVGVVGFLGVKIITKGKGD